jgi:hypothetical protein
MKRLEKLKANGQCFSIQNVQWGDPKFQNSSNFDQHKWQGVSKYWFSGLRPPVLDSMVGQNSNCSGILYYNYVTQILELTTKDRNSIGRKLIRSNHKRLKDLLVKILKTEIQKAEKICPNDSNGRKPQIPPKFLETQKKIYREKNRYFSWKISWKINTLNIVALWAGPFWPRWSFGPVLFQRNGHLGQTISNYMVPWVVLLYRYLIAEIRLMKVHCVAMKSLL